MKKTTTTKTSKFGKTIDAKEKGSFFKGMKSASPADKKAFFAKIKKK